MSLHTCKKQKNFCEAKNLPSEFFATSLRFIYYPKEWKTVKYVLLIKCATILLYLHSHTAPYKRITISQPVLYWCEYTHSLKSRMASLILFLCVWAFFSSKIVRLTKRSYSHSWTHIPSTSAWYIFSFEYRHTGTYNIQIACDNAWTKCDHFCSWLPKKFLLLQTNFQDNHFWSDILRTHSHTLTHTLTYMMKPTPLPFKFFLCH